MVLIFGLGVTGHSVAQFLQRKQVKFALADTRVSPPFASYYTDTICYFDTTENIDISQFNSIILSPGITLSHPLIKRAKQHHIQLLSDIDLCYLYYPQKTYIGITGTNGKSTTTSLLTHILSTNSVQAVACGNIGVPILAVVEHYQVCVIELSSYQLDITHYINLSYGLVLNISADHLDRYHDFLAYTRSKLHLYDLCTHNILNPLNTYTTHLSGSVFVSSVPQSPYLIGTHQAENIAAAVTIAHKYGINMADINTAVASFKGLPHRLEYVGTYHNTDYYNDSKATNTHATLGALAALKQRYDSIALILGGETKDEDYTPLIHTINTHVSYVILLGASYEFFNPLLTTPTLIAHSMPDAVAQCATLNVAVVILSPACASFDMYNNFIERGENFKQCLQEYY